MPNEASFQPMEFKCVKKCFHAGIKLLDGAFKPKRLFICALPMVIAAAVVKPVKKSHIQSLFKYANSMNLIYL